MAAKAGAAWGSTGNPPEIVKVKPLTRNIVPSVVTKAGTLRRVVTAPLMRPTSPAAANARMTAAPAGSPPATAKCMTKGESA